MTQNDDGVRMIVLLFQVLQWDPTTPWSSLTPPTTESRYSTSLDRTGEIKTYVEYLLLTHVSLQVLVGRLRQWGGRV